MKVFISGQRTFGAAVLHLVKEMGHEVAGVSSPCYTETEKGPRPDKLWTAAEKAGIGCRIRSGDLQSWHIPADTDLIIAAHSHDFLGIKIRRAARLGAIGYHPSLLPYHRGRDAIRWTIHMRDPITGGTVYWLNNLVDGGPIAAQDFVFVSKGEEPKTLWRNKLLPLGIHLFRKVLTDLERGVITRIPQEKGIGSWEPSWEREPLPRKAEPLLLGGGSGYQAEVERDYQKVKLYV